MGLAEKGQVPVSGDAEVGGVGFARSAVFGLDQEIASLASTKPLVALAVALLLGLRHPLDPDHLAAVGAMAKDSRRRSA